jgi:hypothetical protein
MQAALSLSAAGDFSRDSPHGALPAAKPIREARNPLNLILFDDHYKLRQLREQRQSNTAFGVL